VGGVEVEGEEFRVPVRGWKVDEEGFRGYTVWGLRVEGCGLTVRGLVRKVCRRNVEVLK